MEKTVKRIITIQKPKVEDIHYLIGSSRADVNKLLVQKYTEAMKNHYPVQYRGVTIFQDLEYEDPIPEMSKTVSLVQTTTGKARSVRVVLYTKNNPTYADNPECKQCFKQVTKLHDTTNVKGEPVRVCSKCVKTLKLAKEVLGVA